MQAQRNEDRKRAIVDGLRNEAERCLSNGERRVAKCWQHAADELGVGNPGPVKLLKQLKQFPVPIDEFIDSEDFLGGNVQVWPTLREDLRTMNPDIVAGETSVSEYIFGGAISTGKSFSAMITQAYQTYILLCISEPQILYGLQRSTPIVIGFITGLEGIARRVLYRPFRDMFVNIPWVQRYAPYDKTKESELWMDKNILIRPMMASVQQILGQALISAVIDEVNFMAYVKDSIRIVNPDGSGGEYDQAEDIYRNASRRRKSRFSGSIPCPGVLAIQSSARYKGDFLYRRIEQIQRNGEQVPIFFRKQYEVRPSNNYCGDTFRLLVGTEAYETRILDEGDEEGEDFAFGARIENVPVEYLAEFQNDPENALRDVVGLATHAISPFFRQRAKITAAVTRGRMKKLTPFVSEQNVVLTPRVGLPEWLEEKLPSDLDTPRFIHIDLSINKDSCGVAMVRYTGHVEVETGNSTTELLPTAQAEVLISIKPNENQEIDIADLRRWVLLLRTQYGYNIRTVSFDGYQSSESIQTIRKIGIRAHVVSVDRTSEPYHILKSMFYTDRIDLVDNDVARRELLQLEYNQAKDKLDHPPRGSKDIADALCGAVYSLTKDRVIRSLSRVADTGGRPMITSRPKSQRASYAGRRHIF